MYLRNIMGNYCNKSSCYAIMKCCYKVQALPSGIVKNESPNYASQKSEKIVEELEVYKGDTITIVGYIQHKPELYRLSINLNDIDCPNMKSKCEKI